MNDLPLSIFDSYEFYACSTKIYDVVKTSLSNESYVQSLCVVIDNGNKGIEKAMGKALKSNYTPIIKESDNGRDGTFVGLKKYSESFLHSKNPAKASAAFNLTELIRNNGNNIHRLSYIDQTLKMNTLINLLSTPEATQWLLTLQDPEWFDNLVADQQAFVTNYSAKVDAESTINIPLLADSKKQVASALEPLLAYIESNVMFNPEVYKPIEDKINIVITDIVTIARARITRNESDKDNPPVV